MAIVAKRKSGGGGRGDCLRGVKKRADRTRWRRIVRGIAAAAIVSAAALCAWRFWLGEGEERRMRSLKDCADRTESADRTEVAADATERVPPASGGDCPADATERVLPADGQTGAAAAGAEPMPYGVLSKRYFDNPVENRLEKLSIPGRGVAMLPPNRLSREEVLEILRRPVEIYDDDDEETVAAKERTAEMKRAALEFIEAGGTYDEFVAETARAANEEAALLKETRVEMMRLLKEEGYEAAEAYLEEANASLREAGMKEMRIPLPFRRKREKELGLEPGTLK